MALFKALEYPTHLYARPSGLLPITRLLRIQFLRLYSSWSDIFRPTCYSAHGGLQTNLVLGQISSRSHHADTTDGPSLSGHTRTRTPRLRETTLTLRSSKDASSLKLGAKAWRQSDSQLTAAAGSERGRRSESHNTSITKGKRRSFPGTGVEEDSRTDYAKL